MFEQSAPACLRLDLIRVLIWHPEVSLQIATAALIKLDAFGLQHTLLFVMWDNHSAGRTSSLSVDHSMPGRVVTGCVHYKPDCSGRVAVAKYLGNLSVGHHSAGRNRADDFINALPIFGFVFQGLLGKWALIHRAQYYSSWSAIAVTT